ncbi:hypothetical protein ODZ83_00165 [Acaricomes phytoseiuli]|uniref:hypothetical protein n=1 Tax=Acaricomes phytoseiuli TaxID=291968 RepID=UPI00035D5FEE|nr:hypothetical protein [Acaricomes phytoseiuli]MCW1248631.1 hypothetical protein [Acaricomes phytoseiuli]
MTDPDRSSKLRHSVKAPLIFSAVLGVIAAVITTFAATGGLGREASTGAVRLIRFDLGLIAFGITFIASLVVCAMLFMSYKENADYLGQGSGVNLRSEDRLRERIAKAQQPEEGAEAEQQDAEDAERATAEDDESGPGASPER